MAKNYIITVITGKLSCKHHRCNVISHTHHLILVQFMHRNAKWLGRGTETFHVAKGYLKQFAPMRLWYSATYMMTVMIDATSAATWLCVHTCSVSVSNELVNGTFAQFGQVVWITKPTGENIQEHDVYRHRCHAVRHYCYTLSSSYWVADTARCIALSSVRLLGQKRASSIVGDNCPWNSSLRTKCSKCRRISGKRRTPVATKWHSLAFTRQSIGSCSFSNCILHIQVNPVVIMHEKW